jgi:1-phosphatidylinositol-3-phosphate 5-kinase
VANRIRSLNIDFDTPEKIDACRAALSELARRAEADRKEIADLLEQTFHENEHSSGLALNSVRLALQNKVVEWDGEFASFEQKWLPSEKDVKRLTRLQITRFFSESSVPTSPEPRPSTASSPPASDLDEKPILYDSSSGASTSSLADEQAGALPTLSAEQLAKIDADLSRLPVEPSSSTSSLHQTSATTPHADNDDGSDSTVCGPETLSHGSPSHVSPPTHDSGIESEESRPSTFDRQAPKGAVADLVRRFDPPENAPSRIPQPTKTAGGSTRSSLLRPPLRRGKTEGLSRITKPVSVESDVLSEGDDHKASLSRRRPLSRAPADRLVSRREASGNVAKSVKSVPALAQAAHRPQATTWKSTSSTTTVRRPDAKQQPNHERARANESGGRGQKGKAPMKVGKLGTKDTSSTSASRPAAVSIKAGAPGRRIVSQNVSSSRVSTLARHFDHLSREVERDRQRRLAMVRGKRARPVAVARPVVQVFDNVKDAVKEDSDTESESSDAADDEYEGEAEDHEEEGRTPRSSSQDLKGGAGEESDGKMPAPPHEQIPNFAKDDQQTTSGTVTPSLAESHSPSLVGSNDTLNLPKLAHLSESEMSSSGPERQSIMRTLTNLWAYRGAEWKPLEYPTCVVISY